MKKAIKIGAVILGIIILLLIGLSILVKAYLSGDRLKAIILPKAEAVTGRKIQLETIHVSLFKGIVARGLSVKEKDGQKDFLKTGEFVLSYRLLPLLKKQLVISKIEIVSPSISIKRYRDGKYNFSDLMEKGPKEPPKPSSAEPKGLPLSIMADRLLIRNGSITVIDEEKTMPDISLAFDAEFKGGIGADGKPRMDFGVLSLKELKALMKEQEIRISGKIDMDPQTVKINLQTLIGKDSLEISGTVKDYLSSPSAVLNVHAKSLDLEKLMALSGDKKGSGTAPPSKSEERKAGKSEEGFTKKLKASGEIKVDQARYQAYLVKDFRLSYHYAQGTLKLDPLGLSFSGGDSFTADGTLQGSLGFSGEEASMIKKTMKGTAVAKLGKGMIKQSKIFDAIVLITGVQALKNPTFDQGLFNFDIKGEKVNLDGSLGSDLYKISPKGWMDFEKRLDIPTELKLSPKLSGSLSKSLGSLKLMEDEQGWKTIPLRIRGTADQPSVGLDDEALKKQLVPTLQKGIEQFFERKTRDDQKKSTKKK